MMISDLNHSSLFNLPKVELHCHLELAYRPSTMKEWAIEDGDIEPDCSDEQFQSRYMVLKPMDDLPSVLNKFLVTRDRLKSLERLERLAFEACEDMYLRSNVRILELRYAPSFTLEVFPELGADNLHEAFMKGCTKAETMYPIAVGLICLLQRIKPIKENEYWCDWAIDHKGEILALDLADDEVGFPPSQFAHIFMKAKAAGLGITIHAGEPSVPQAPENIITSIEQLGADRIGHGVQAIHDESVIEKLVSLGIVLELCPTSNVLTRAVDGVSDHPLKKLMELGVKTTINSDDPGVMCIDLMTEYHIAHDVLNMSIDQLKQCNSWAAHASFIPANKKSKVWANI
jgi:adenosine deaminase|tara:strand:+ start:1078 stop:2109 length:1032 start_codon:yes stop_codon:yes gene_type:complete